MDVNYIAEHYQQNKDDDNYTLYETASLFVTTDTLTNGSVKTYEGFTSPEITQVNINGDGSTVIKLYYTRNNYTVSLYINNDKAGTISGSGTYKYGKEITIIATTNLGYTFDGWYDGNNELYETEASFDYEIVLSNVEFEARYTPNEYTITIDNQATGITISGIISGNEYECDSQITLTATGTQLGYSVIWTRSDGVVYAGNNYEFNMPADNITITIVTRAYIR